jgi:hypothetical protein
MNVTVLIGGVDLGHGSGHAIGERAGALVVGDGMGGIEDLLWHEEARG